MFDSAEHENAELPHVDKNQEKTAIMGSSSNFQAFLISRALPKLNSDSPSPRPLLRCDSILAEAKNLSFNATAAFKAYSNIKANVDAAEKEAKAAKQSSSEALALVSEQG